MGAVRYGGSIRDYRDERSPEEHTLSSLRAQEHRKWKCGLRKPDLYGKTRTQYYERRGPWTFKEASGNIKPGNGSWNFVP